MNQNKLFFIGIIGVLLFAFTCTLGGFLIDGYSVQSQYISETYAVDAPYGVPLRVLGHIPSGILFTLFGFYAIRYFPSHKLIKLGWLGIALFYGIGTILVAVFPCDSGCNIALIDASISQIIHNLAGLLVYVFVPFSILFIGVGLTKFTPYKQLSAIAIGLGVMSIIWVGVFLSNPNSEFIGLHQRGIEIIILTWIFFAAFTIKTYNKI